MKRIMILLAMAAAFVAVFVAQASAAQACFMGFYDPEVPENM